MFCPKCGLERQSSATSFCSRCGFLLTGTADLIELGGLLPDYRNTTPSSPSARSRGVKQGLFIFLLSFLIVPLLALVTVFLQMRSPVLPVLALLLLAVGGALRMVYAWLFEAPAPSHNAGLPREFTVELAGRPQPHPLPDAQSTPVSAYAAPGAGRWRDTNDLEPRSVTEGTTKLLENEEPRQ
jgi:hypothetical protein